MGKFKSKGLAAVLAMMMIFIAVLNGCSGSGKTGGTDQTTTAGQSGTQTAAEDKKPVNIKIFGYELAEFQPDNNPIISELEKRTNTVIEFEIPPITNYTERLQVMLATGSYPDVVQFSSHTDKLFVNAVNDGIIIPITDQVSSAPNLQKYTNPISWKAMKVKEDKDIYGIPRCTVNRADGFVVRQDWLESVGLSVPEDGIVTLEELTEILRRFTKNDPDKNGKNDTYGITISAGSDGSMHVVGPISAAFGLLGWQKLSEGEYEYMDLSRSRTKDNYKRALEYTAMLWKEGLIDPNWPNNKGELFKTRFDQGLAGVIPESALNFSIREDALKKVTPSVKLTYITRIKEKPSSETVGVGFGTGYWWLNAVTKTAKGKEDAIVKFFDYQVSDEGWFFIKNGVEGVHYSKNGDKLEYTPEYDNYYKWRNYFTFVRRFEDADFFIKGSLPEDYKKRLLGWLDTCVKDMVMSKDEGYRPAAADEPELIDYGNTMNQAISKIIVGASPVNEWDKVLDGWYKAGGEEYTKQMNEYIKKSNQ